MGWSCRWLHTKKANCLTDARVSTGCVHLHKVQMIIFYRYFYAIIFVLIGLIITGLIISITV
jgi:hypothetical protein